MFFMQAKDDPEVIQLSLTYILYVAASMPLWVYSACSRTVSGHRQHQVLHEHGSREAVVCQAAHDCAVRTLYVLGITGIWFSMSFSNLVVCLYGYWVYKTKPWYKSVLRQKKEGPTLSAS